MDENIKNLIYICDDDKNIAELIKMYLINDGFSVETFFSGEDLLNAIDNKQPNLITLDIMLPNIDGFSVILNIKNKYDIPVILVSAKDAEVDKIKGFNNLCDDYIVKPFMPMELVARIKAILRRFDSKKGINEILEYSNIKINKKSMEVVVGKNVINLTPIEYKFLLLMIERPNEAITKKEILHNVWGYDEDDNRVIDDLLKRFRKKLSDNNAKVKIETIRSIGYRLE